MSMTGTPIPRINNSISSLSKILATAACIMLIGYVGYLVVAQYRAQVALQKSQQQLITQEIDRRAGASSFFFSAQTNSLKELSQAREIAIYFENQALGMSLEYGLSASLSAVQDRFDTFQQKSRLERHPVYTWLLFLPPRGKPLALSGVDVTATHPRWSRYVRREAQTFYLTDTEEGAARIVISVPCIFKEKVVGQILGIIPLSLVYDHFIGNREGSPDLIALVRDERYLLLPASHQALLSPSLRALLSQVNPEFQLISTLIHLYLETIPECFHRSRSFISGSIEI